MARPRAIRSDHGNTSLFTEQQRQKLELLKGFRALIAQPDVQDAVKEDDRLFSTILTLAFNSYGVRQAKLVKELGVSPGVLGRWSQQTNLPPAFVRPSVLQALVDMMDPSIDEQESDDLPLGLVH